MSLTITGGNVTAPTQFLQARNATYAYRRFGQGTAGRYSACSISQEHSTTGIRRWSIRLRRGRR